MAWTRHGHRIPGSAVFIMCIVDPKQQDCGGIGVCKGCDYDTRQFYGYLTDEEKFKREREARKAGTDGLLSSSIRFARKMLKEWRN